MKKKKYKKKMVISCYAALAPQLIGFCVFSVYPVIWVIKYSFTNYNGYASQFVGLQNYVRLFLETPEFWQSIGNALILTFMKMALEIPLSFLLAMLLCSDRLKGKKIFSILLFLPTVVGATTASMFFNYMFRTFNGIANNVLEAIGIIDAPVNWFGEKWWAMCVIIFMSTWMTFAINMMYFCGAISGVPKSVYESAAIDGCTGINKIFRITIPMIAPTAKVILMLALTGSIKMMDEVLLLTKGGPYGSTNVVMLYLFNKFFGTESSKVHQYGFGAAGAMVVTVLLGFLTVFYLKVTKKADELYE